MRVIKNSILISLIMVLSACSYLSNNKIVSSRDSAYLKAKSIPPITVPPGLSSAAIHDEYPVPNRAYSDAAKKVNLMPPELH